MQRDDRRRARGVNGDRRAAQIQEVRQPVGDNAQRATGIAPRVDIGQVHSGHVPVVGVARAGEDAGLRAAQGARRNARVFQCLPSDFEQHPLLRVHLGGFAGGDVEELGVEFVEVVHVPAVAGGVGESRRHLRSAVVERRPAFRWHLGDRVLAVAHELPELVRAGDVTGESTAQTDHRDRLVEVSAVGLELVLVGQRFGAGQEPCQVGNRRMLPELDR